MDLLRTLIKFAKKQKERVVFWLDFIVVDQNMAELVDATLDFDFKGFAESLKAKIVGCGHTLSILSPFNEPIAFHRAWW